MRPLMGVNRSPRWPRRCSGVLKGLLEGNGSASRSEKSPSRQQPASPSCSRAMRWHAAAATIKLRASCCSSGMLSATSETALACFLLQFRQCYLSECGAGASGGAASRSSSDWSHDGGRRERCTLLCPHLRLTDTICPKLWLTAHYCIPNCG